MRESLCDCVVSLEVLTAVVDSGKRVFTTTTCQATQPIDACPWNDFPKSPQQSSGKWSSRSRERRSHAILAANAQIADCPGPSRTIEALRRSSGSRCVGPERAITEVRQSYRLSRVVAAGIQSVAGKRHGGLRCHERELYRLRRRGLAVTRFECVRKLPGRLCSEQREASDARRGFDAGVDLVRKWRGALHEELGLFSERRPHKGRRTGVHTPSLHNAEGCAPYLSGTLNQSHTAPETQDSITNITYLTDGSCGSACSLLVSRPILEGFASSHLGELRRTCRHPPRRHQLQRWNRERSETERTSSSVCEFGG